MTTTVTIKNQSAPVYSDGTPNKHAVKILTYDRGYDKPQEAIIGPGETISLYVYEGHELVVSETVIEIKEKKNEIPDDGYDWRPSDV